VLGLYTPSWCWYKCPEIGTSTIDWAHLRVLPEDGDTIQSPKRRVLKHKQSEMDNVQKHSICVNKHACRHQTMLFHLIRRNSETEHNQTALGRLSRMFDKIRNHFTEEARFFMSKQVHRTGEREKG
jgi:hypothetical protein